MLAEAEQEVGGLVGCLSRCPAAHAIHLIERIADSYVHFTLTDLAVPFASDWKPGAVAFGVIAAWLLVAVELTSLAMRRLPRRVWRAIHFSRYLVFWLTSIHAALAGTDRTERLYQFTAAASIVAVAWALMYRLANRRATQPPPPPTQPQGLERADARAAKEN